MSYQLRLHQQAAAISRAGMKLQLNLQPQASYGTGSDAQLHRQAMHSQRCSTAQAQPKNTTLARFRLRFRHHRRMTSLRCAGTVAVADATAGRTTSCKNGPSQSPQISIRPGSLESTQPSSVSAARTQALCWQSHSNAHNPAASLLQEHKHCAGTRLHRHKAQTSQSRQP